MEDSHRPAGTPAPTLSPPSRRRGSTLASPPAVDTSALLEVAVSLAAEGLIQVASGEFLLASARTDSFGRLFGRDSLITSLQLMSAVRLDPSLAPLLLPPVQGSLRALATLQGVMDDPWTEEEPGKIIHEYNPAGSGDFPGAYYASVDSTPLFLMALHQYAAAEGSPGSCQVLGPEFWEGPSPRPSPRGKGRSLRTQDAALRTQNAAGAELRNQNAEPRTPGGHPAPTLLEELRGARDRALTWIMERADLDGDGLVEFLQRNPERKSLINQNWKDSRDSLLAAGGSAPLYPVAYAEVQAYCYRAVMGEAALRRHADPSGAEALTRWADRLAEQFESRFWMPAAGCYAQALDAEKRPLADIASNAFHWLWLGPRRPRRFRQAARRLLEPDLMTPAGLRTLSSASPNYAPLRYHRGSIWPWDNWVAASALRRLGMEREAAALDAAVLGSLARLGCAAELYAYRDGSETPSMEFLDVWGRPAYACRIQAWTVGYLVEMVARGGAGGALRAEVIRRQRGLDL